MDTNQTAARDARRYLLERVRNDWDWPPLPPNIAPTEHAAAAAAAAEADYATGASEDELRGVTEFRERYYGSTDDDNDDSPSEDEAEHGGGGGGGGGGTTTTKATGQHNGGPKAANGKEYRFDSPEHVGPRVAEERAARRKRRRRRALEEEMRWNEGMAVFVRRRDRWTGAASVRKYARRRSRSSADMHPAEVEARDTVVKMLEETALVEEVVAQQQQGEHGAAEDAQSDADNGKASATDGEETSAEEGEEGEQEVEKTSRINIDIPASEEPLVPLAPPLLPQNVIRQSITPKTYSDIYAKIVVSGQTPKVPINLSHMTRALVQGWKDDGEWPPRPGPVDPLMGRKKIGTAAGRVGTLAAVLGGGGDGGKAGSGSSAAGHHGEFLAHHPHLQKGVESVKKVFRLSGGHHVHSNPGAGLAHDGHPPPAN